MTSAFDSCPNCPHSMTFHDGDGTTEHFACCDQNCECAWEYAHDDSIFIVRPAS